MLSREARRAFTLLEVLIAVGIFAFAAMGLLLALDSALGGARATQRDAMVRDGMANRLAALSVGALRETMNEDSENGVTYRQEVQREEVTNEQKTLLRGFWRLKVKAQWNDASGPQTWEISHLVYRSDA